MSRDTNNNNNNHLVMFLSDGRNLELTQRRCTVIERVSRGIWDEDWGLPKASNELHEVPENKIIIIITGSEKWSIRIGPFS